MTVVLKLVAIAAYATIMASDQAPDDVTTFRVEQANVQLQDNRYALHATLEIPAGYQARVSLGVDPHANRAERAQIKLPKTANLPFGFRTGCPVPANHLRPTAAIELSLELTPRRVQCIMTGPTGTGSASSRGGTSPAPLNR